MKMFRRRITFNEVAKFNYILDTNKKLKDAMSELSLLRSSMSKTAYLEKMLKLFNDEGVYLTLKELDMLMLLRIKTDQLILEKDNLEK